MSKSDNIDLGFAVEIVYGNALEFPADVLAVKDTPQFSGVDTQINRLLETRNIRPRKQMLNDGSYLIPGQQVSRAKSILYVSVGEKTWIDYDFLRELGRRFLENLSEAGIEVRHLALTVHGPGLGLDEIESFRALLLGMADAYEAGHFPPMLEQVTFVDRSAGRVRRLQEVLQMFFTASPAAPQVGAASESPTYTAPGAPPESAAADLRLRGAATEPPAPAPQAEAEPVARIAGPESFEPEFRKPAADDSTPHVFVAMPFKDTYDDQFYLAIQPCVKDAGLLCERMDLDAFTGDITERMLRRIESARLVIALLDGGNPNVYLEVGYAWGVRTKTVLLAHKEEALPFDVRGHRVLIYDKIYLLKDMLKAELDRLLMEK